MNDPNLLVGFETNDDCGVYRIAEDRAILVTADFITPPVDDPYVFGQVGAANALGDVYAMGGRPLVCLNLICFPSQALGPEVLEGIVAGALDKISEAGAVLAGGHTVEDEEPKFGLSVTGEVHPERIWRNVGAVPGDRLILTKPVGSGVLFNANLRGWLSKGVLDTCLAHVTALNRVACEAARDRPVHAATDVTGFGLAGHAREMVRGSGAAIRLYASELPVMQEAVEMYEKGVTTGANAENRRLVEEDLAFEAALSPARQEIFVDPQTSGGLLLSVPGNEARGLLDDLHGAGVSNARIVGEVVAAEGPCLRVV